MEPLVYSKDLKKDGETLLVPAFLTMFCRDR